MRRRRQSLGKPDILRCRFPGSPVHIDARRMIEPPPSVCEYRRHHEHGRVRRVYRTNCSQPLLLSRYRRRRTATADRRTWTFSSTRLLYLKSKLINFFDIRKPNHIS